MKSSSMNKSYYMIVKLFLCYDVKSNKQTNKQNKQTRNQSTENTDEQRSRYNKYIKPCMFI